MDYKLEKTKNGLEVLIVPMLQLESSCVTFWVKSGSRYEEKKTGGISHFLEHMAFKGGKKYKTAMAVSAALDGMGAEYNAATSKEWTCFYVKVRVDQIEKAFDILSDMLVNPNLSSSDIERERGVVLEEIAAEEDQPAEKVGTIFSQLIFANHPLGEDIAGTPESVKQIQKKDLIRYRDIYYVTQNSLLTVSGGVTTDGVLKMAEKYFSAVVGGPPASPSVFSSTQKKLQKKHVRKDTEQTHLLFGFLAYPVSDSRKYAQTLLSIILGGGMSSRLFTEIREKRGLAYSVGTSVSTHQDVGVFATYAGVDPKNADEVVKLIISEHESLLTKKRITKDEIQKAKDYLKGRTALSLEDTFSINSFFAKRKMFLGQIETPHEYFEKIDRVKIDQLESVVEDLINPQKYNLAVIGPEEIRL